MLGIYPGGDNYERNMNMSIGRSADTNIEMAVDKESLVICQTFKSGNTQLVTFVGKEELTRLRDAVDEALGSEPAKRLPQGACGLDRLDSVRACWRGTCQ